MHHFATIEAYERKAELGGGFCGLVAYKGDRPAFKSEPMPTREQAWRAAQRALDAALDGRGYAFGHYRGNRWVKNVFVAPQHADAPKPAKVEA